MSYSGSKSSCTSGPLNFHHHCWVADCGFRQSSWRRPNLFFLLFHPSLLMVAAILEVMIIILRGSWVHGYCLGWWSQCDKAMTTVLMTRIFAIEIPVKMMAQIWGQCWWQDGEKVVLSCFRGVTIHGARREAGGGEEIELKYGDGWGGADKNSQTQIRFSMERIKAVVENGKKYGDSSGFSPRIPFSEDI